jgi:hypothetical protein
MLLLAEYGGGWTALLEAPQETTSKLRGGIQVMYTGVLQAMKESSLTSTIVDVVSYRTIFLKLYSLCTKTPKEWSSVDINFSTHVIYSDHPGICKLAICQTGIEDPQFGLGVAVQKKWLCRFWGSRFCIVLYRSNATMHTSKLSEIEYCE